jgi:RimJ/RimL family protein N-acetyltransferase
MTDNSHATSLVIRLATPEDIELIEWLDSFSASPTRDIHRAMDKYFGSIDPTTHERTLIFLAELDHQVIAKTELMIPSADSNPAVGYIKRVIVHPEQRGKSIAQKMIEHVIIYAQTELELHSIDLHVWDQNHSAIHLYEKLGFQLKHRELYYRLSL